MTFMTISFKVPEGLRRSHSLIIWQEKAVHRVGELFEKADRNNDGQLTMEELRIMMKDASKEYPHLQEHSRFLEGRVSFAYPTSSLGGFALVLSNERDKRTTSSDTAQKNS